MPRPPSKHGLERKFKPWRRGKSSKTKSRSSLKNQLRGKERLLAKLNPDENDERRAELKACIRQLREEMERNHEKERQRKNAVESHGTRFLERQRLTRMERTTRKLYEQARHGSSDKDRYDEELKRIALDQVYVAHFPHEQKYQPLFRKGVRIIDERGAAHKRAAVRQRILQNLASKRTESVKWIASDQYNRVPNDWNVDLEISTFGVGESTKTAKNDIAKVDNRFALDQQHSALLEAAEKLESALDDQPLEDVSRGDDKDVRSSDDRSFTSSSDDDEADPLQPQKMPEESGADAPSSQDSSTTTSSDDDSSDESSTSSSSSSSDESSDDEDDININTAPTNSSGAVNSIQEEEEQDDFLVPVADDEPTAVFDKAKHHVPAWDDIKGDKSRGWATQRQRPDQRKRRRT